VSTEDVVVKEKSQGWSKGKGMGKRVRQERKYIENCVWEQGRNSREGTV